MSALSGDGYVAPSSMPTGSPATPAPQHDRYIVPMAPADGSEPLSAFDSMRDDWDAAGSGIG